MELKQAKPIHLRCPKCGYDFSYNTNHIEEEMDRLKNEITSISRQIAQYKAENPKDFQAKEWYKKAKKAVATKQAQLSEYKKARKATNVEIKLQTFQIFKNLVAERIGKEEMLKLIKEAESEMIYYDYDMATQKFTRFDGA